MEQSQSIEEKFFEIASLVRSRYNLRSFILAGNDGSKAHLLSGGSKVDILEIITKLLDNFNAAERIAYAAGIIESEENHSIKAD